MISIAKQSFGRKQSPIKNERDRFMAFLLN